MVWGGGLPILVVATDGVCASGSCRLGIHAEVRERWIVGFCLDKLMTQSEAVEEI